MNQILIEKQLQNLGFSDHEAKIYLQLLALSPANATLLAKRTGIARSSIYLALNELTARGLVSVTFRNNVRQFIAEDPQTIQELLEDESRILTKKMSDAEGIIGSLKLMQKNDIHVPNVVFFEGQESLKKIYLSMLRDARENSTMLIIRDEFVWVQEWAFIFQEEWHDLVRRLRTEKNIATKILVNPSKEEKSHEKFYRSRKAFHFHYLPKHHQVHDFAIYIMNDITSILSFEKNNVMGIKITNEHITKNFCQLFNGLWSGKNY